MNRFFKLSKSSEKNLKMSMDKEEQVYKVTKNLRRQLPYDEIRRKVRRDTHLSFSDSVQSINSLISKDLLKHSEKIPFFFCPNPPKEKIKFKRNYDKGL